MKKAKSPFEGKPRLRIADLKELAATYYGLGYKSGFENGQREARAASEEVWKKHDGTVDKANRASYWARIECDLQSQIEAGEAALAKIPTLMTRLRGLIRRLQERWWK